MAKKYVGSVDQGTTSTRFILFDENGLPAFSHQLEHKQIYPKPGWVEHDPMEIWSNTAECIKQAMAKGNVTAEEIAAIGITDQRETIIAWNPKTGKPYYNAIVWQDQRGAQIINDLASQGGKDRLREKTGLPLSPYFSGSKMQWMLDNVPGLRTAAHKGEAIFGNIDTWILWNLTGAHITDVTNACRTLLMNIETLNWDQELVSLFDVPMNMLPEIRSSIAAAPYGFTKKDGPLGGDVPVAGILGDQQAALFGQACFRQGMSKSTYGTGGFLLMNTGKEIVHSKHGLLTTVAYKNGNEPAAYALEGSVAIAGSLIQWVRDNLQLVSSAREIDELAESVENSGDMYFVPAFAGLYAPHWRPNARGVICGLTGYATRAHFARAVLESTAFQTREIFDAMKKDAQIDIPGLKVDGGMVVSEILMQFQSDILNVPVIRPKVNETTALGAAYAAGLSVGFWADMDELSAQWAEHKRWQPNMTAEDRYRKMHKWNKAVERSLDWIEPDTSTM